MTTDPARRFEDHGGNPHQCLVDMAKTARKDGVSKGILFHREQSNPGDKDWPTQVKGFTTI